MNKQPTIQVRDVMKRSLNKVNGVDTVQDALDKMVDLESRILIVDKRNEDDEYGVVLLADIAKQVIAKDRSPQRVNIYEIMSKPVISVREDMDIRYCSRLFSRFGLNIAPVSDKSGELVGTVSYKDIVLNGILKASK
ncbi:MAG: CBS domain-containing protein [Cocleimonas sp.]|nr:CBS domain-containing protein [Cocleimonas sp.]